MNVASDMEVMCFFVFFRCLRKSRIVGTRVTFLWPDPTHERHHAPR